MVRGLWLCAWAACALLALVSAEGPGGGGSLRGALEALQRRQRARLLRAQPAPAAPDYDLYDLLPPDYVDPEYTATDDLDDEPNTKYIIKVLGDDETPLTGYEYKIVKKKSSISNSGSPLENKESPFRERSRHSDNDRLRELFMDKDEGETRKEESPEKDEKDAEYALLLGQLWSKYKNRYRSNHEATSGVMKLYKEKDIKKRLPDNWGPVAFKRKRSPNININNDNAGLDDYLGDALIKNDKTYLPDDDRNDMTEEYTIAFQPLDDEGIEDFSDEDQYQYDGIQKRFPVTKRSSGSFDSGRNVPNKRFVQGKNKYELAKQFRSSSGTDPKVVKDLSKIFGDPDDTMKLPVKRSSKSEDSHESKPPQVAIASHNHTHEHNASQVHNDDSHELHSQNIHHPGTSGKETDVDTGSNINKPITVKKKSIDWSNYFGIDKRKQKFLSSGEELNQDKLPKQYFNTFNKEVILPIDTLRKHSYVKKNIKAAKPSEEREFKMETGKNIASQSTDKKDGNKQGETKFDDIDQKLKNMEGYIVDEALRYSEVGDELDSKEEQELKEQMITRLAAAYSLEKMRKALKEFKQSLQIQKHESDFEPSSDSIEDAKNANIPSGDFENERGVGLYVSGKTGNRLSDDLGERTRPPAPSAGSIDVAAERAGGCPVLGRAAARCRSVGAVGGRRARLFLPLCSLHQICYLCGEAPPTACDLAFLSEADTACGGDAACARAARGALMALRQLQDALADELDAAGECDAGPCLIARQRPLRRR
ncbi:hypothetical protein EVAR_582_1 [Eumeta japonica]|uniref:Uncharacterized protein n=1 Tax=Eumeta variegata TaxID=151549 RepID=A0A4C1SD76_EUMVA|nr:hypothetical protein EVAR_582_1 [Eumeta japonica]